MANAISIRDPQTAKAWLAQLKELNQDYYNAMDEASKCLESMGEFMEGTAVDEFAHTGTNMLTSASQTFEAIEQIADTVNTLLDAATTFSDTVVGSLGSVVKAIFG